MSYGGGGVLFSKNNNKKKKAQYFCTNCLQGFNEASSRDKHYLYCRSNEDVRIEMPNKKPIVKYSDGQCQFKIPFMMYADFESILKKVEGASDNPNVSSTREVNIHLDGAFIPSLLMESLIIHLCNIEVRIVSRNFVNILSQKLNVCTILSRKSLTESRSQIKE